VDGNTLKSGTVSWSTTQLPGGTYGVHAHYAGDGTFGANDSGAIVVTVTPETSAISLSALTFSAGQFVPAPPSLPYGTTVYLRADVTPATNKIDSVPTGTVTFTDNNSGSQAYPLNSEGSAIAGNGLCTLGPGAYSFTASYSGDNSYQKSGPTSPPIAFGVTQVTPQITTVPSQIAGAVNSTISMAVLVGAKINFNPVTGTLCSPAPPSGTVSLFNGTTQIASSTIATGVGNSTKLGQAIVIMQFSAAALPFGQSNITVKYSGDANYSPATSTVLVQVGFASTTTVTSPNSSVAQGANMTFTAQVTSSQSGGPPITGSIVFQVDFDAGTTVPLVNGSAQFTTSFPSAVPNSHKITARYSGDQNYIPSRGTLQEAVVIPDFTLSDSIGNGGNVVIAAPGNSSAPITLTISGTSDYNGTISFGPASCVITPAGSLSSCSFTPSSVTGSGTTQLVINTTAPKNAGTPTGYLGFDVRKLQPIGICLFFLAGLAIFKKQRRLSLAFGSVILLALFGLWACSGGGNTAPTSSVNTIPGTPTGVPYAATVNAAPAGSSGHSITVPFIVQ
jgi:Bacterial Ig-like domain (group 3)